ncbi:MAG: M48 family metalloprotease [Bacteriovoracaceae bacterium]|nr:M48 family metalloprotease [Bacteriovoracaceae bacterium]
MKGLLAGIFILLQVFYLYSCGTGDVAKKNVHEKMNITLEEEMEMTRKILPDIRKDYPAHHNQKLQQYMERIGGRIIRANNLDDNPYKYTFTVADVDHINSFSLPAGVVFITAPLIASVGSEAELAGVICHEIAHITNRHSAKRMYAKKHGIKKGGILRGAGLGLEKLICKKDDKKCLEKLSLTGGIFVGAEGALVHKYKFMRNSQMDEMEADRDGFKYAIMAGYSKDHIGLFYKKLLGVEKSKWHGKKFAARFFADAVSIHPPSKERVGQMDNMGVVTRQSGKPIITSNDFENARASVRVYMKRKKERITREK